MSSPPRSTSPSTGLACANGTDVVRVASEGYPAFELSLDSLEAREQERGTTASLVRGMAHEVAERGGQASGL